VPLTAASSLCFCLRARPFLPRFSLPRRLCGLCFCGSCTAKYHLPRQFEQKGKNGPTRVCIGCRDSCLQQKQNEADALIAKQPNRHAVLSSRDIRPGGGPPPSGPQAPRQSVMNAESGVLEIYPPLEWEEIEKFIDCHKVRRRSERGAAKLQHERAHESEHLPCDDIGKAVRH
jgi:hypothetical protein